MQTQIDAHPRMTLEQFADKYGLNMEINERSKRNCRNWPNDRYYARFHACEVMGDGVLISEYGNGKTPEQAMENYGYALEGKRIAVNAYSAERVEIEVPNEFVRADSR